MTLAEEAKQLFIGSRKTESVAFYVYKLGGVRARGNEVIYLFPDGSKLITKGRGRNHKIITEEKET